MKSKMGQVKEEELLEAEEEWRKLRENDCRNARNVCSIMRFDKKGEIKGIKWQNEDI